MRPAPARSTSAAAERRTARDARERSELQRLAFDFIVHELGNAASPILMTAEILDRDGSGENVARSSRSIRETAANLQEVAAAVRYFRSDPGNELPTPAAFADTGTWWRRLLPLFATCLPRSAYLSQEIDALGADDRTLATLTWCTLGILRLIDCSLPDALNVAVGCETNARAGVALSFAVNAGLPDALTVVAKRWRRFVTSEARMAGAHFTIATGSMHTSFDVSL